MDFEYKSLKLKINYAIGLLFIVSNWLQIFKNNTEVTFNLLIEDHEYEWYKEFLKNEGLINEFLVELKVNILKLKVYAGYNGK